MREEIIIAGSGGQGIMLLGKVLAEAAMRDGKYVTWLPSYGAEVRGGTANCTVVVSDEPIGSPYVDRADTAIIMNEPSRQKFERRLKKGGLLIVNSTLAKHDKDSSILKGRPFTDIASKLGNIKTANIVALGFFIACKRIVSQESILAAIRDMAPEGKLDLIEINSLALKEGVNLL